MHNNSPIKFHRAHVSTYCKCLQGGTGIHRGTVLWNREILIRITCKLQLVPSDLQGIPVILVGKIFAVCKQ